MIEFLNYQPFYYLIGIRMIHIILLLPVIYLTIECYKDMKTEEE